MSTLTASPVTYNHQGRLGEHAFRPTNSGDSSPEIPRTEISSSPRIHMRSPHLEIIQKSPLRKDSSPASPVTTEALPVATEDAASPVVTAVPTMATKLPVEVTEVVTLVSKMPSEVTVTQGVTEPAPAANEEPGCSRRRNSPKIEMEGKDRVKIVTNQGQTKQSKKMGEGPNSVAHADSLWATGRDEAVKLRMETDGPRSLRPLSVMTAFQETVGRYPEHLAMATKIDGAWRSWTYRMYYDDVWRAAKAFIKLGLEVRNSVGILGFNSPEWFISNFAAIFAGGLSTGIYSTNSPEACKYVANHAQCNILVVENNAQLQKVLQVRDELPHLKAIVQYSGELKEKHPNVYTWVEMMTLGEEQTDEELMKRIKGQSVNKCCGLIYTSGTTGHPKGVMLSHDNYTWTARVGAQTVGLQMGSEAIVSYLPLSHVAAQVLDMYMPLLYAAAVYFAQPDALKGTLVETLKEARPTVFLGVPRVWEKMQDKLAGTISKQGWVKRSLFGWARHIGLSGNLSLMIGGQVPFGWTLANSLIFKKIRAAMGLDRCKTFMTAAAPIMKETLMFFASLNMPIMEIFGMSESTGPHTVSTHKGWRLGSVGPSMLGTSVVILKEGNASEGEICLEGRNVFMGYLDEVEKTRETIDSLGLLHSGDLGHLEGSFLYITGRIKELLITAGGENVAPVPIEDAIKECLPCVSNCMLVGDRKKFLSILLTLKTEVDPDTTLPLDKLTPQCMSWCKAHGCPVSSVTEVLEGDSSALMTAIQEGINAANKKAVSRAQIVQKFSVLPRDFSIAGGELGPTLKLKRNVVLDMYNLTIDAFYEDES